MQQAGKTLPEGILSTSTEERPEPEMRRHDTLCHRCQALRLDGQDPPFLNEYSEIPEDEKMIPVAFSLEDSLPKLPNLTASSENGCKFCSVLISAAQQGFRSPEYQIHIESSRMQQLSIPGAHYVWTYSRGLSLLVMQVQFRNDDATYQMELIFEVECSQGMSHSRVEHEQVY